MVLSFAEAYPMDDPAEVALEDYARVLTRARAAEALRGDGEGRDRSASMSAARRGRPRPRCGPTSRDSPARWPPARRAAGWAGRERGAMMAAAGGPMIADYLRVGRLYFLLLAIFTVARLVQGATGVPYDKAHHVFSVVTLTFMASAFFGAFCRRWRGYTGLQAMGLGLVFGVVAQLVIFTATAVVLRAGAETFFNHPRALNVARRSRSTTPSRSAPGGWCSARCSPRSRPGSAGPSAASCRSRSSAPTSSLRPPQPRSVPPRAGGRGGAGGEGGGGGGGRAGCGHRPQDSTPRPRRPAAGLAAGGAADRNAVVQLDPDHPGFRDAEYRARRNAIAQLALDYRPGTPVPDAPYTAEEDALWRDDPRRAGPGAPRLRLRGVPRGVRSPRPAGGPHPPAGGGVGEGRGRQRLPAGAGGRAGRAAGLPGDAGRRRLPVHAVHPPPLDAALHAGARRGPRAARPRRHPGQPAAGRAQPPVRARPSAARRTARSSTACRASTGSRSSSASCARTAA